MKTETKKSIRYFSLIDKNTNKEVYTSLPYFRAGDECPDYHMIFRVFKFYFNRINSGIKQQMESPKVPEEQKKQLKLIDPNDYKISFRELLRDGGYHTKIYWTKNLSDYSVAWDIIIPYPDDNKGSK